MKKRKILSALALTITLFSGACAPSFVEAPVSPPVLDPATTLPQAVVSTPDIALPAPTQVPEVLPVATSRGPDLEATDPTTVNLASGQLQLVEFFRFT